EATVTIRTVADEPAITDELAAAVRSAYDAEQGEHGLPVATEDLVAWLCHHRPDLFKRPLPPLSDWCAAAGLDVNGNLVAHSSSVWRQDLLRRRIVRVYDLVSEPHWRRVLARAVEVLADPDATIDDVRS